MIFFHLNIVWYHIEILSLMSLIGIKTPESPFYDIVDLQRFDGILYKNFNVTFLE
jgi:hypothetical protein